MTEKKNCKKICAMGLAVSMMFSVLCGCSQSPAHEQDMNAEAGDENTTLWVLTEISKTDGMNCQANQIIKAFEKEHEGVEVKLEILPTEAGEREVYLKQLRTQIMAGEGPDVYLLPTGSVVSTDIPGRGSQTRVEIKYEIEPLFRDVSQAMYNGVFVDIASYYDADIELNTEGLQKEVMDAGIVDGKRYVLPIRYDIPTLFVNNDLSRSAGVSSERIEAGISALVQNIIERKDDRMAIGLQMPADTVLLSTLFDYEKSELLVTEQEIAEYMRLYQEWYALSAPAVPNFIAGAKEDYYDMIEALEIPDMRPEQLPEIFPIEFTRESFLTHDNCINTGMHWSNMGFPLYSGSLQDALEQSVVAGGLKKDLESYPLRAMDGSVVAEITYYGAVGAGTRNPELAYEFLRTFLAEDYQWDMLRPQTDRSKDDMWNLAQELQNDGLVENSWPVRAKGAAYYLWKNWRYQIYMEYSTFLPETMKLQRVFGSGEIMASMKDMNVLNYEIDEVRFPFTQKYEETLEYALTLLNNEDGTPADVNIEELAKEVYKNLWWHLAEG